MPRFDDPAKRGNLFLLLRVELPRHVDAKAVDLLREVLPAPSPQPLLPGKEEEQRELEEFSLVDLDPTESARQHHIVTGGLGGAGTASDNDEAPPAGSPGPPPPGCCVM